jgi:hypothetical protein
MYRPLTPSIYDLVPVRMSEPKDPDNGGAIEWIGVSRIDVDQETGATTVDLPPMTLSQRALLLLPVGRTRLKLRITHRLGPPIQIDGLANQSGNGIGSRVVSKTRSTVEAWTRAIHDPRQAVRAVTRSASDGATLEWEIVDAVRAS